MAELINLGFAHRNQNFEPTYNLLNKLSPNLITLELGVLEIKKHLQYLHSTREKETEFEAGYIFAKEKNIPLYAIDSPYLIESNFRAPHGLRELSPDKIIKYNLTKIKYNPLNLYPPI